MPHNTDPSAWVDALAGSHDRLCALVGELDSESLSRPSYCDGWTIAQVLSHLGSGAEITRARLKATLDGAPPPSEEEMRAVWRRWDALTAHAQAESFIGADGELVETLENLGDRLDDLRVTMFGMDLDAATLVGMRLSEHALHAWDVDVSFDPAAKVDPDAIALLVDLVPMFASWAGKADRLPSGVTRPYTAIVRTSEPARPFVVRIGDHAEVQAAAPDPVTAGPDAHTLELPAEAFVRLVYGRLDPAHSPAFDAEEEPVVEVLRAVFPGF